MSEMLLIAGKNLGKFADAPISISSVPTCRSIYESLSAAMQRIHMTASIAKARYRYIEATARIQSLDLEVDQLQPVQKHQ
jgi:hypothetical protein